MEHKFRIDHVRGREILDSRGNPTIEVEIGLCGGARGRASVPSGASTGAFEAVELRDRDIPRYGGKGVKRAVEHINETLSYLLDGKNVLDQAGIDRLMIREDGTQNKGKLGANAILGTSLAAAQAAAQALGVSLYRYLGGAAACRLPVPMINILNGGAHAKNSIDLQEFMIVPVGACCYKEAIRMGTEVYQTLARVLNERNLATAVGDEGGFAPDFDTVEDVLDTMTEAVQRAGYETGRDICFALDVAASEWKPAGGSEILASEQKITGQFRYHLPKSGKDYTTDELIQVYRELIAKYPVISIEDPLDEEDWTGWKKITEELGDKVQLVGDDLFVTNTNRLARGIENQCGNSILIKLNQIGSLSETIEAIRMAHQAGYTAVVSHRSGETEDTTIADLAVALNCGQIKTGAPCRSERVAKYNQLLRIEEELGETAVYPGRDAFKLHPQHP